MPQRDRQPPSGGWQLAALLFSLSHRLHQLLASSTPRLSKRGSPSAAPPHVPERFKQSPQSVWQRLLLLTQHEVGPARQPVLRPAGLASRWRAGAAGGGLPVARGGRWGAAGRRRREGGQVARHRVGARSQWKRPFEFPILYFLWGWTYTTGQGRVRPAGHIPQTYTTGQGRVRPAGDAEGRCSGDGRCELSGQG